VPTFHQDSFDLKFETFIVHKKGKKTVVRVFFREYGGWFVIRSFSHGGIAIGSLPVSPVESSLQGLLKVISNEGIYWQAEAI
jgi:hypothetical protein